MFKEDRHLDDADVSMKGVGCDTAGVSCPCRLKRFSKSTEQRDSRPTGALVQGSEVEPEVSVASGVGHLRKS